MSFKGKAAGKTALRGAARGPVGDSPLDRQRRRGERRRAKRGHALSTLECINPDHRHVAPAVDDVLGQYVCPICGYIIEENYISRESEVVNYGNSDKVKDTKDHSRTGGTLDSFSGSTPSLMDTAIYIRGKKVDLPYIDNRSRKSATHEKQMREASSKITQYCTHMNLPDTVISRAKELAKMAILNPEANTRTQPLVAAACVYIACKEKKAGKTLKDVARECRRTQKRITEIYKSIKKALKITISSTSPEDLLNRYRTELGLEFEVYRVARHILEVAGAKSLVEGRRPQTSAAAALLFAIQVTPLSKPVTIAHLSETSDMGEGAIKDAYKALYPYREYLFPADAKLLVSVSELTSFGCATKPLSLPDMPKTHPETGMHTAAYQSSMPYALPTAAVTTTQ